MLLCFAAMFKLKSKIKRQTFIGLLVWGM